jgi:hypothetical protein
MYHRMKVHKGKVSNESPERRKNSPEQQLNMIL